MALPYELDTLNTFSTGFLADIQSVVVEGLIAPDEEAKYFPSSPRKFPQREWRHQAFEDGKRMDITFKLRPNVTWSDGAPFTSEDVKFTWLALKDPKFIAESKEGVTDIDAIDTPDPLTAIIRFNTVTPIWPSGFFSRGILSKARARGQGSQPRQLQREAARHRALRDPEFKRGQYVIADRNPRYWRKDANG